MRFKDEIRLLLPELRAYAFSICERRDDAEDLVQDAVARALTAGRPPEILEQLRPWMFRIIRNLHYDELRKMRVRREYLAREKRLYDEYPGTPDRSGDILVRLAFEGLPPDTREVLFLIDIMGLKYKEAALVMNVPQGTVMSRISRARRVLLERIEGKTDEKAKVSHLK